MFDRISNSFALARSSWQVLRTDKPLPYGQARAAADLQRTTARQKVASSVN